MDIGRLPSSSTFQTRNLPRTRVVSSSAKIKIRCFFARNPHNPTLQLPSPRRQHLVHISSSINPLPLSPRPPTPYKLRPPIPTPNRHIRLQIQTLDFCTSFIQRPKRDSDVITSIVIEDSFGNGIRCLRAQVGYVFSILEAIDE